MDIVKDLWRYANAAYVEPRSVLPFTPGASLTYHDLGKDFCFVSIEHNRTVFAFRGTDTAGKSARDSSTAWRDNLRAFDRPGDMSDCGIHDGFWAITAPFMEFVISNIRAGVPTFFTGHSRGSAMAAIAALRLVQEYGISDISVLVFGTPNWCSKRVRDVYDGNGINHTNVNTSRDLVTRVPPKPPFYRPGKEYTLRTQVAAPITKVLKGMPLPMRILMGLACLVSPVRRGVVDHMPETYDTTIERLFPDLRKAK